MIGGANRDEPDLSWKVWVTEPRHGAEQVRRETRALCGELRSGRTLKNASGMTSTRWRTAAHGATGRFSHDSRRKRVGAAASVGCPEQEPRLRAAAVKSAWSFKILARTGAVASRWPKRFPKISLAGALSGPACRRAEHGTPGYSNRKQPILTARIQGWQAGSRPVPQGQKPRWPLSSD